MKEGMIMYTEKTIRRKAYDLGYKLEKNYMRYMAFNNAIVEPKATGYMLFDLRTNEYVWGSYNDCFCYLWSLEDVENYLREVDTEKLVFKE